MNKNNGDALPITSKEISGDEGEISLMDRK